MKNIIKIFVKQVVCKNRTVQATEMLKNYNEIGKVFAFSSARSFFSGILRNIMY